MHSVPAIASITVVSMLFIMFTTYSCSKEDDSSVRIRENSDFIKKLNYDPHSMLKVQSIEGTTLKSQTNHDVSKTLENNNLIVCDHTDYNLKQNAEQVAILRPTNGIIWPGALVKLIKDYWMVFRSLLP